MKLDHEDLNRLIEKISTSDIQEFSLEGEDFKLEIKRNLFNQNQFTNNSVSNNSYDRQTIANQKAINDNVDNVTASGFNVVVAKNEGSGVTAAGNLVIEVLEHGQSATTTFTISASENMAELVDLSLIHI